jgi:myo-inositol catabolism protein IolS
MQYRQLGKTSMSVSVVAMGCWALAGDATWGPQDEQDSLATVRAALDHGINLFDTAEGYGDGRSEEALGKALAGRRHEAIIATKVSDSHLAPTEVAQACERSLRRLRTDYVDLYQIHWPSQQVPLAETMDALEKLRDQGKVRAIGVCNFGVRDLTDLLALGRCETDQLPYNLLFRAIEYEIKPQCLATDIGILCYSPLCKGLLTGKFHAPNEVPAGRARSRHYASSRPGTRHGQAGCEVETFAAIERIRRICAEANVPMADAALGWLLAQPGVTSVLAGARTPRQIEENAKAADLGLSVEILGALSAATDELKQQLGSNADEYQADSRIR